MKRMILSLALLTTAFLVAEDEELPTTPTEFQEKCSEDMDDVIFEFAEGMKLPLSLSVRGDIATLQTDVESPLMITFQQKIYAKFSNNEFYLSQDQENWVPFFRFFTGEISLGISEKDGNITSDCEFLVNARQ